MASNIKVVCRFRPQNSREKKLNAHEIIDINEEGTTVKLTGKDKRQFNFDKIFTKSCTQKEVFDYSALPTVEALFKGYNGTIFAYGQTGSGKTHTMQGPDIHDEVWKGLIPRIIDTIFQKIRDAEETLEFLVQVSYIEIYMERIRDLLNPSKKEIKIREDKSKTVYLEGVTEVYVASEDDVTRVMDEGQSNRKVAATKMNAESSRSHSIFILTLTQKNLANGGKTNGKLYLVDLAGSEKVGKTGASGQTLEEAKGINKSLSALGNVINALTSAKTRHIPYRDSKLTRLLQQSLGGNSRTTLCINCSPSSVNEEETTSTLRFGTRAKSIKNKAKVNKVMSVEELTKLLNAARKEITKLKRYNAGLEDELRFIRGDNPVEVPPGQRSSANQTPSGASKAPASALSPDSRAKMPNVAEIENKCTELEDEVAKLKKDNDDIMSKFDSITDELADKQQELAEQEEVFEELKAALAEAKATQEQFEKENNLLQTEVSDLRVTKQKVEFERDEMQLTLESVTEQNTMLEEQRDELQKTVDELEAVKKELEQEGKRSKKKQSRMDDLNRQQLQYLDSSESLRKSLEEDVFKMDALEHKLENGAEADEEGGPSTEAKPEDAENPDAKVDAAEPKVSGDTSPIQKTPAGQPSVPVDANVLKELETLRAELAKMKTENAALKEGKPVPIESDKPADTTGPIVEKPDDGEQPVDTPTEAPEKQENEQPQSPKRDSLGFIIEEGEGQEEISPLTGMDPINDQAALLISTIDDIEVALDEELDMATDTTEEIPSPMVVAVEEETTGEGGSESVEVEMMRADLEGKEEELDEMTKENEELKAKLEKLTSEYDSKFSDYALKKEAELNAKNEEKRVQLEKELNALREKTAKKLKEFDQLKNSLLRDLQNRCEKVIDLEMLIDEAREQYEQLLKNSSNKTLQKRNTFLEKNLTNLRRGQQKLVNQNNALRLEKKVSEKKLAARNERIRGLEVLLTNAQEKLQQKSSTHTEEIAKYKVLVDQLQSKLEQANRTSQTRSRSSSFNTGGRIARPIRGGGGRTRKLTASGNLGDQIGEIVESNEQKKGKSTNTKAKGKRSKKRTTSSPSNPAQQKQDKKASSGGGIFSLFRSSPKSSTPTEFKAGKTKRSNNSPYTKSSK